MRSNSMRLLVPALFAMLVTIWMGSSANAQSEGWHVSKSSGEVSVASSGAQPVALRSDAMLNAGDTLRTGQNGRVLLTRGAETILVSANSVVGIPTDKLDGYATTIVQQVGSILLEVEKKNVQHFEVATPYLAAVVKGTQFRVTVDGEGSHVEVIRGQVQVTDYKTGQFALVNPGQAARVLLSGVAGLSLDGSGTLSPIQSGPPRRSSVSPIAIPNGDSPAPRDPSPAFAPQRQAQAGSPVQDATAAPHSPDADRRESARGPSSDVGSSAPTARPSNAPLFQSTAANRGASDTGSGSDGWMAGVVDWGKSTLGIGGHKTRDNNTGMLVVPAVIGLSVALGAGVFRRKRKSAKDSGSSQYYGSHKGRP
jgi:hypothetical protein